MLSVAADAPATADSASATSTTGVAQRERMRAFCISTLQSEIAKRTPRESYGSARTNGLPRALSPRKGPDDEPDEGQEQPGSAPMAQDDGHDEKRQEGIWKSPGPPRRPGGASAQIGLACGEVSDQLIELVVGPRRQGACDALVELLVVDPARQMLTAKDVADRLALRVANAKLPVSRRTRAVIRHDSPRIVR